MTLTLEIKNLHVQAGDKQILKGLDLTVTPGRDPRADGPQRLRQVDARQRDHGPPEPRGHRGPDPLQRRGHHRGRPGRARPHGPLHGLPVPGLDPRRDDHEVPADGHERAPRGARRGADPPQGLPQDRRGGDGARRTSPSEFSSRYLNEGFSGGEKKRLEMLQLALQKPKHRRPRRDRLRPRHRRAQRRRQRRQHASRPRPTWAS